MARKKKEPELKKNIDTAHVEGLRAEVLEQPITDTLTGNYMPYAMSVIVSRAIPEIDGFKPSHRKLLYTMYKMGLLNGGRTKSANIVGQTMRLNPHGDAAIYETMVRLARGNETLLHPFVDSKGNFGKVYSRDMAYAASRYTEAKLEPICAELFRDIDADTVDFVDNYDSTMREPTLLPAAFPSVLVNANTGIAVGMASSICPFNLAEVCTTAAELIRDPKHDIFTTMQAPDFPGGGQIIFDRAAMEQIYKTGRGSIKVRSRYTYDKSANCIDITQIPPTTTIEAIVEKVIDLVKQGKVKEITDIRDETGLDGLKITIDLKRGADPDKLKEAKKKDEHLDEKIRDFMCSNFYDIRTFGAVMTTFVKASLNCGQVRGPVQLGFARSVDPIMPQEVTITRVAITTEADAEKKDTEMGRKYIVPYGLYRAEGYVSANLARKTTGFSEDDLNLLWTAILNMFENDHSAARGKMAVRELIVFKHDSELGCAPAHKLFDLVKAAHKDNVTAPRSYEDYTVTVDEAALPAGVTCTRLG